MISARSSSEELNTHADDTQLYMSIKPGSKSLSDLLACLNNIRSWMGDNFLQLNENKAEVLAPPSG